MRFEQLAEQRSEKTLREMLARYDRGERCFVGLDLAGVEMRSGRWVGADLWRASFRGAGLVGVEFQGANLSDRKSVV